MKRFIIICFVAFLYSCSSESYKQEVANAFSESESISANDERILENKTQESKLIKEAYLTAQVANVEDVADSICVRARCFNGYITNDEIVKYDQRIENNFLIRIPAKSFDQFLTSLEPLFEYVVSRRIYARDVTEEYIDIDSRLIAQKEVEKRYIELLGAAKTVEDILKIEEKIGAIREEIDAKIGRLKYIDNQVNYSNINLTIYKETSSLKSFEFFNKFIKSLKGGWQGLLGFIVVLGYLWPFIILGLITTFTIRRYKKKHKK